MIMARAVIALATAGILLSAPPLGAQAEVPKTRTFGMRFTSGGLVPTGSQREIVKDAQLSGAQLSMKVHPAVAVTGSFSWASSRDLATAGAPKLDVFTSDVGLELCPKQWGDATGFGFTSFAGLGAGARSYNYRKLDVDATHNLAAYGAIGGELGMGRVGLRVEVRDYVAGFRPLIGGGKSETRNDLVIMAGFRFNRRQS